MYTLNLFKKVYKNKKDAYNLNIWNEFENNNQRIFAGMYQFWCQFEPLGSLSSQKNFNAD